MCSTYALLQLLVISMRSSTSSTSSALISLCVHTALMRRNLLKWWGEKRPTHASKLMRNEFPVHCELTCAQRNLWTNVMKESGGEF